MIDDFLTSPDDLPPVRPRRASRAVRNRDTATRSVPAIAAPTSAATNPSRAALAAGVLLAASVAGVTPVVEAKTVPGTSAAASRLP